MSKIKIYLVLLALFLLTALHVSAQDRPNLVTLLENDPDGRFTTLLAAIGDGPLSHLLTQPGPYTLLAPTNDAFAAAFESMGMTQEEALASPELGDILAYHVVPGKYFFRDLISGPSLLTALASQRVTFALIDGNLTANGSVVSDPDNPASNGVMHAIDSVLLPPDMMAAMQAAAPEPTVEATPEAAEVAGVPAELPDLVTLLENDPDGQFTTFVAAIEASNLRGYIASHGPYTLIAPTNDAFAAALDTLGMTQDDLLADRHALSQIVLYHFIPGEYYFRNLLNGATVDTLLRGQSVTFALTDGFLTVEGATLGDVDNRASNGVMHVSDTVLLPPDLRAAPAEATPEPTAVPTTEPTAAPTAAPTPEATVVAGNPAELPDLVTLLENDPDGRFTTLVAAIDAAGLRRNLNVGGPFTLLAPTNDAFTALFETLGMTQDQAFANPSVLTQVLLYHAIPGEYFFRNLITGPTVPTLLQGESLTFALTDGFITVEGASITDPDNRASNGVVHALDTVLLPPAMRALLEATPEPTAEPTPEVTPAPTEVAAPERPTLIGLLENDPDGRFTTLVAAIDAAGLRESLDAGGSFTLLAPSNDAFTALLDQAGMTADDLLAQPDTLRDLLYAHVIQGAYFFRNLISGPTLDTTLDGAPVAFALTDGFLTANGATISDTDNPASNGVMHVLDSVIVPPSLEAVFAPPVTTTVANTGLRFAQFSPDAERIDIYINGELSDQSDLSFATVTDWQNVEPGFYEVGVALKGGDPVVTTNVEIVDGTWVTIAVTGSRIENSLRATALFENFAPLAEGRARVGVFNGVLNSSSYDIVILGRYPVIRLGYPGTLGNNDGYDNFDLAAGTYDVQFVVHNQPTSVILDLPQVTFEAGTNTLISAAGSPGAPGAVIVVSPVPAGAPVPTP